MVKKDKVDAKCICDQCPRRFICFTQKKVFSDPAYQAMYEAFVEEGVPHEQAVKAVREFIQNQKIREIDVDIYKKRPAPAQDYDKFKWEKWQLPKQDSWENTPFDKFKIVGDIKHMALDDAVDAINDIKKSVKDLMGYGKSTKR